MASGGDGNEGSGTGQAGAAAGTESAPIIESSPASCQRPRRLIARIAGLACLVLAALAVLPARAEPVVLQLKWTHAFQFAGYYVAQERGYYREAGLEVTIREAGPDLHPVDEVVAGRADFGIGMSSLLLERHRGRPVLALAAIFQHSPMVLAAARGGATETVHDLTGKRVMIEPQAEELAALLMKEGLDAGRIVRLPHSFALDDLIRGRTDAMTAYSTTEPYWLDRAGFRYSLHSPRSAGIDFYGDTLFTTERQQQEHPQRTAAFVSASLRGWREAMANVEDTITLIRERYSPQLDADFLRYEAREMQRLMRTDLIEVGYMHPGRWRHIADTYADLGLLPRDFPLDGFIDRPAGDPRDSTQLTLRLILVAALATGLGLVATYVQRTNRRLRRTLAELAQTADTVNRTLQHTAETQSQLLVTIAHEFRTPAAEIAASAGSLRILRDGLAPAVTDRLDNIDRAARRLSEMTNHLLTEERLSQQALQLKCSPLDVARLLESVVATYPAGQRVRLTGCPAGRLTGDAVLFRVAVHNLIDNALGHNAPGGEVVVAAAHAGQHWEIDVADQGSGIPDDRKPLIFHRFVSGTGQSHRGFGLAIVKTIATAHGGDVTALDNRPRGTVMRLTLPDGTNSQTES